VRAEPRESDAGDAYLGHTRSMTVDPI